MKIILKLTEVIHLDKEGFERLMGMHGAPLLVGLRPACLLSFQRKTFADIEGLLASYQRCFQCKGISMYRLAESETCVMILFYRAAALSSMLHLPQARALLESLGYPVDGRLSDMLGELEHRVCTCTAFPHEIGLFLGYPVADVRGFMEHHGHAYRCSGCWKVYADEAKTRALFDLYASCTRTFCARLAEGTAFPELVQAV